LRFPLPPIFHNSIIILPVNKSRFLKLVFLFCLSAFSLVTKIALQAQSSAVPASSLVPNPKSPDVPSDWKGLVGVYGDIIILERNQQLFWRSSDGREEHIYPSKKDGYDFAVEGRVDFASVTDSAGSVTALTVIFRDSPLRRTDAGSDPSRFYYVQPLKPIEQLRATALAQHPPKETGPFRKPELVELVKVDSRFHLDIRYAQDNNFLSTPVYSQARAFMQRPAAEALVRVLHKLEPLGYGLLIHDAYRPWYVTKIFWDATPAEGKIFVADPKKGSRHNRGCAVDLTLYDLTTGKPIEMPGLYDEMSPRSFPNFQGGTSLQRWHRDLLRRAMESEGFSVNEDEWWHFDYKDWKSYAILNVTFEELGGLKP
jgi:D-alanyl-D-alanine dipeptidase